MTETAAQSAQVIPEKKWFAREGRAGTKTQTKRAQRDSNTREPPRRRAPTQGPAQLSASDRTKAPISCPLKGFETGAQGVQPSALHICHTTQSKSYPIHWGLPVPNG